LRFSWLLSFILIGIIAFGAYCFIQTQFGPMPETSKIQVKWYSQRDKPWCLAASMLMILDYWGISPLPSLEDLAQRIYNSSESLSTIFGSYNLRTTEKFDGNLDAAFRSLKKELASGNPVIAAVWSNITSFEDLLRSKAITKDAYQKLFRGHAVVVTGYNSTGIFVNNPWNPWSPNAPKWWTRRWIPTGADVYLTNAIFVKLWTFPNATSQLRYYLISAYPLSVQLLLNNPSYIWFWIPINLFSAAVILVLHARRKKV